MINLKEWFPCSNILQVLFLLKMTPFKQALSAFQHARLYDTERVSPHTFPTELSDSIYLIKKLKPFNVSLYNGRRLSTTSLNPDTSTSLVSQILPDNSSTKEEATGWLQEGCFTAVSCHRTVKKVNQRPVFPRFKYRWSAFVLSLQEMVWHVTWCYTSSSRREANDNDQRGNPAQNWIIKNYITRVKLMCVCCTYINHQRFFATSTSLLKLNSSKH